MDHHLYRRPNQLHHVQSHSPLGSIHRHSTARINSENDVWCPSVPINPSTSHVEMNGLGKYRETFKRRREHHLIITSSQDDDYDDDDLSTRSDKVDDDVMMDCDNDTIGPNKRRRFAHTFPFTNNGQIIEIKHQQEETISDINGSTVIEECTSQNASSADEEISSLEWWRKKRHPDKNISPDATASVESKLLLKQDALSPSSAMDLSGCVDEISCHICRKRFPLPATPLICQVMPTNALLNYFTPLNKKGMPNCDVVMATNDSHQSSRQQSFAISPACCSCCDRPSCPDCRRECKVCQKNFCSFCSIDGDGDSCFCLDCYDQLR